MLQAGGGGRYQALLAASAPAVAPGLHLSAPTEGQIEENAEDETRGAGEEGLGEVRRTSLYFSAFVSYRHEHEDSASHRSSTTVLVR